MKRIMVLATIIAYAYNFYLGEVTASDDDPKSVHEAAITDYPFMVFLQLRKQKQYICGGALITPTWALTAAECLTTTIRNKLIVIPPPILVIFAGAQTLKDRGEHVQMREIVAVIPHPSYRKTDKSHDTGLVKAKTAFNSSDHVGLATIPLNEVDRLTIISKCEVVGWAKSYAQGDKKLIKRDVELMYNDNCTSRGGTKPSQQLAILCTTPQRYWNACILDIGGPLLCDIPHDPGLKLDPEEERQWRSSGWDRSKEGSRRLVGINTHVGECGLPDGKPMIKTRISEHRDWLIEELNRNTAMNPKRNNRLLSLCVVIATLMHYLHDEDP